MRLHTKVLSILFPKMREYCSEPTLLLINNKTVLIIYVKMTLKLLASLSK